VYPSVFDGTQLHHHHNEEGSGTVLTQNLPKACVCKVNLISCYVPIFQSLASTVAEINRRVPNFFLDALLAQLPSANFGPKRCFFW